MSLIEILRGQKQLLREHARPMRSRMQTIEQAFSRLTSASGRHDYRNPYPLAGDFSRDGCEPTYGAIEPDCATLHPDAIDVLMRDRNIGLGQDIQWVTVTYSAAFPNGHLADYPVRLSRPVNTIVVASMQPGDATWFHFQPLGMLNPVTGVFGPILGTEQWLPFPGCAQFGATPQNGTGDVSIIKFKKPVQNFFLSQINSKGGIVHTFTLACSNDIDYMGGKNNG